VNLSAGDLYDASLPSVLRSIMANYSTDPSQLVFEITESVMLSDPDTAIATLHELKELGVRIALDDFGTGYSSLSHLCRLPVDVLKIAQPFVDALMDARQPPDFIQAIVRLGDSLHLEVIAEGIERTEQVGMLVDLGCRRGQGNLFAEAMPRCDLVAWLAAWPIVGPASSAAASTRP